jgi:autotransporter-associated beta strand protein
MEGFVGLGCNKGAASRQRLWLNDLRGSTSRAALALAAATLLSASAWADVESGQTVAISTLSGTGTTLAGGTVQLDGAKSYSRDFTLKDSTSSTIDALGNASTLSGKLTGKGNITFSDSKGGGKISLTNYNNDFTGTTTVGSNVTLALFDSDTGSDTNATSGTLASSQRLIINDNGTFDISGAVNSISLISLSGSGNIVLGSNMLSLNDYNTTDSTTYATNTTYSGVISGAGSLTLTSGEITLTGVNTLTGTVTVASDTMHVKGAGSISQASAVVVYGTLDFAGANSAVIKSLSGSGTVALGDNDLVLTAASGAFTGNITTTHQIVLQSGTEFLGGSGNTIGQGILVQGGTLQVGGYSSDITVGYNIANSGTVEYYNAYAVTMNGVVSGAGIVNKWGSGIVTITTAQTYTGATTINAGTLKLSGAGSIASSSGVQADAVFDLTESSNAAITSLTGIGTVRLGAQPLAITGGAGDFSGTITGTGTLTISGGTQSLSGINTYTGATTITGGKLVLVAGSSLKSAVTLAGGNLDLTASSTATGAATINSLAGTNTVTLGSNTLVLSAASGNFAGTIQGAGNVTINSGTETFSGSSIYTGTTTVAAGKLILTGSLASTSKLNISGALDATGASGASSGPLTFASLAGSGTVAMGAHGLVLNPGANSSTVFSGVISGSAGLTVNGAGVQILSGANTYTGGTTIGSGATLQIGNGNNTGAIFYDATAPAANGVANSGTLRFARLDKATFANNISGTGNVVQAGIGTTILTGNNTYTGTTTISAGTLQIGDGTTTGSIAKTTGIVDDGTLAFSPASGGTVTINTAITGTGNVSILTGTVILESANSYTGTTRIAKGATLQLTDTANLTQSDSVAINGTLDLTGVTVGTTLASLSGEDTGTVKLGAQSLTLTAADTTFAGAISGPGSIILQGGTQVLSGNSPLYTGATVLNGGTLTVTGLIANSAVTVNTGATLTGTGSVGAVTVNGGTVMAGANGAGTLTSTGDIAFNTGSTYVVDMTSAGATALTTTGKATLAVDSSNKGLSKLKINSTDGTYALGKSLTILTANGGLTGTFDTTAVDLFTAANGTKFTSKVGYTGTGVTLEVDLAQLSNALGADATRNQLAVAGGIDKAIAAKPAVLPPAFSELGNLSSGDLQPAADQLSGEIGADMSLASKAMISPFLDIMSQRTAMVRPLGKGQTLPLETWVSGYASGGVVAGNTDTGAHKFRSNVYGVAAGAQWMPWANTMIGGAISAGRSDFRVAGDLGKGNATSIEAGVYGYMQASRHFYSSFEAAVAGTQIKTTRVVNVSGNSDTLTGKLTTYTFGGRFETGVQLAYFSPYIAVQDHVSMLPGYSEGAATGSAATFALDYASRTYNSGRAEVGLRHYIDVDVTPRWILTPDFTIHLNDRLAYAYDLSDGSRTGVSFVNLPSSAFDVYGAKAKRHELLGTVGADVLFNNGVRITTHFDAAFTQKSESYTGFAGIGYTW